MKITKINSDQIKSLSEIGIDVPSINKIEDIIIKGLNDFFENGDLKALNFVKSISFINQKVDNILKNKNNKDFFRGKLKSIRRAVLGGFEIADVMGKEINFEVFPPGSPLPKSEDKKESKAKEELEHPDNFPRKYWTMLALREWGVKFTIRSSKERKDKTEPYSLFFIPEHNCTIAVANEYGKATYFFPMKNWQKFAKSRKIDDLRPDENIQWLSMPNNIGQEEWGNILKDKLSKMQDIGKQKVKKKGETSNKKIIYKKEPQSPKDFENEKEEIAYYKNCLDKEIPRLIKETGLVKHNGKYICEGMKMDKMWGKIFIFGLERNLTSFPNAVFLQREYKLKKIRNSQHFSNLMKDLGYPMADKEEKKSYYKECLDKEIPRLIKKVGLVKHNGKYIFSNVATVDKWVYVTIFGKKKRLASFPYSKYLKDEGLSNEKGAMTRKGQLKKLFKKLGYEVASEKEEIAYYKNCLDKKVPELIEKAGLSFIKKKDGQEVFFCGKMKGFPKWGKLIVFGESKNLVTFPNLEFLREKGIIDKNTEQMMNRRQFEKLLEELGYFLTKIEK